MVDGNNSMKEAMIGSDTPKRATWGSPLEFILACLGYAVGLGNVWRFPYLCYRNGGGAFLIPFFLMIMLIGLPLFYLELYVGQYTALGPLKAFQSIGPFFSGVGYCTLMVISMISIYYMIIVAWTLYYTVVSIVGNLEWGTCVNDYNTDLIGSDTPKRATWGSPLEFILACLGYAVGLGNVWRFPYLCYRNGGGAFLIPFFLMIMLIGLPLFYLELYVGQYTALGPLKAFQSIGPFFSGVGYCTLMVISMISIYYMIIVAWTLYYTVVSIVGNLEWGTCVNDYNTDYCYSGEYDAKCRENNTGDATDLTYYMRRCMSIAEVCTRTGYEPYDDKYCLDGTETIPWYTNATRILASEEYYNQRVLGIGDSTWENWGSMQWHLVGCLFGCWVVAFLCVIKGVQSAGKVVYFTALFPYVMLTALLIRGVTLDGASEGILFYLTPKWENLLSARVWGDAASQTFYSFGVACGSLVTLASYNNFTNNCHFDAVFVCVANYLTSIYAGFVIFSVLGFQADKMGVSVDDVAQQGPGLAFVVYPEALLQMPIPQLWCILFFFMLFILGMGSQFAGIEAINTAIVDRWPVLRKRYWMVTAFTCFVCFILGLPMCFSGGVYLFTLLDWNTASWAILLIGIAEVTAVSWSYGINRALKDLESMNMKFNIVIRLFWKTVWLLFVPIVSFAILIFVLVEWTPPSYGNYEFPLFADLLGWAIGISTIIFFPIGVAWAIYKGYRGKDLFTPTSDWKPAVSPSKAETNTYDNMAYQL